MSFRWDWLVLSMTSYNVLNYYQLVVCDKETEVVLYRLGRDRGVILKEVHIIQRSSPGVYRISSYADGKAYYTSCPTAKAVCEYIIGFIPNYVNLPDGLEEVLQDNGRTREYLRSLPNQQDDILNNKPPKGTKI